MEQSEDELRKKDNEFLTKIQKRIEQNNASHDAIWERQKKETEEEIKWRMRMDYESMKRSEEIRQMFHSPNQETLQNNEKRRINWGFYLIMAILGLVALFFTIYGIIFISFIAILFAIQDFLFKKRY